ncbi:MAG TPA: PSD1 and planctomycete cytochrome C domain-containing protein [Pirellulales bacterium]|nr:PSD1 and planctomycete cytochrome C domain-containing protein [Pirellulales bacterium]
MPRAVTVRGPWVLDQSFSRRVQMRGIHRSTSPEAIAHTRQVLRPRAPLARRQVALAVQAIRQACLLFAMLMVQRPFPVSAAAAEASPEEVAAGEFFEKKIRPLLADNCYNCHSASTNSQGGLRIDDRNGLLAGGGRGPAIIPGNAAESLLIRAVRQTDDELRMPPKKQLSEEQIADLEKWINDGAVWPGTYVYVETNTPNPEYDQLRKTHWAWQPVRDPAVPVVADPAWSRDPVDAFVHAKLEEQHLIAAPEADRRTLIRRVTYDLTGLPPTPQEVDAFLWDGSPTAYEELIDRLLASPAFGERWGRHWLDVARYGESTGSSRNLPYPHAWRYRDYVIAAFNKDKPYDQFVREQIAGDLLPADSQAQRDEQLIATGFLALGVKDVNQRYKVRFVMDNIDEQIDTMSRSILAVTASCARCHDHKFDPIPTTDYYALAGIFHSTDLCAGLRNKMGGGGLDYYDAQMLLHVGPEPTPDPGAAKKIEEAKQAAAAARTEFEALRGKPEGDEPGPDGRPKRAIARQKMRRLQLEVMAMTDPIALGQAAALGVRDAQTVGDTEIRVRGEAEKLGPKVPRGFLSAVSFAEAPAINPAQSGRLELAAWLTSPQNPLTARVIVNRVWQHLFGRGLVKSVDNFGVTGDVPTHPELLDHLAARFVREGWSMKKLVRELVLSRTYRLSSDTVPANTAVDPTGRFLWRHVPRRLAAEEIRDSILALSGQLNTTPTEGSPAQELKVVELRNNGPEARHLADAVAKDLHRSVYLPLLRDLAPSSLSVFDFAEQGMVTGHRDTTTVAPQSLYMLNDPFVRRQALALAERLLARNDLDDAARVDWAYRLAVGRAATHEEVIRTQRYLADYSVAAKEHLAQARPVTAAPTTDVAAAPAKPAPANPDEADQSDEPVVEDIVQAADENVAAWASFCQALFGSAEFRYLK